jgi:hypothetical protein
MTPGSASGFSLTAPDLTRLRPGHPRLFLTPDRLTVLRAQARDDARLATLVAGVLRRAEALVAEPVVRFRAETPQNSEHNSRRLIAVKYELLENLSLLGFAWQWTGDARFAERGRRELLNAARFPDWNTQGKFLDPAVIGHAVGVGYDWLHGAMDDAERREVREALVSRLIDPALAAHERARGGDPPLKIDPHWVKKRHNWNAVCNGGMLVATLAVAEDEPARARRALEAAAASLPHLLAGYAAPDGATPEGPFYWDFAMRYVGYTAAALETALGDDMGIGSAPGLERTGEFVLHMTGPTGETFNVGDVPSRHRRGRLPVLLYLAGRYGQPHLAAAELADLDPADASVEHVMWYPQAAGAGAAVAAAANATYRGIAEFASLRSGWDRDATWLATRAGTNAFEHQQLDLGSFELEAGGRRWVVDLGRDAYKLPGYLTDRTRYYRSKTLSHNVMTFDGRDQSPTGRARIVESRLDGPAPFVTVDLTDAYPGQVRAYRRTLSLDGSAAVVRDEITLDRETDVRWSVTTDGDVAVESANHATIRAGGNTLHARLSGAEPAVAFSVSSAERQPPEATNEGYRCLEARRRLPAGAHTWVVRFTPGP